MFHWYHSLEFVINSSCFRLDLTIKLQWPLWRGKVRWIWKRVGGMKRDHKMLFANLMKRKCCLKILWSSPLFMKKGNNNNNNNNCPPPPTPYPPKRFLYWIFLNIRYCQEYKKAVSCSSLMLHCDLINITYSFRSPSMQEEDKLKLNWWGSEILGGTRVSGKATGETSK